jgi:Uma2 family endonuclease
MPASLQPLSPTVLAQRWEAMCADPAFNDVHGNVELDQWGDVLTNRPFSFKHGSTLTRIGIELHRALGGHPMALVGILTAEGVRSPDVSWCSEAWLAAHPDEAPLMSAPEICVEILSTSNTVGELRRKARAYPEAGALEVWIVSPAERTVEIHTPTGQTESTAFPLNLQALFRD